jgi:hypothetical protein
MVLGQPVVVMNRPSDDGSNATHMEPYLVDKNGNGGHWLTSSPLGITIEDPAWSPDGSRILASTNQHQLMEFDVVAA